MVRERFQIEDCKLKILGILLVLSVFSGASAFSQEVAVSAKTDSTNYRIGDWIHVRVDAQLSSNLESITPAVKDSLGAFEILNVTPSEDGQSRVWIFTVTTFDSGKAYIPPISFAYRLRGDTTQRIASSNSLMLNIRTIAVDPEGDIRDIKLPLVAPWTFEDYLPYMIAMIVALLAVVTYFYWRRKQKQKAQHFEAVRPEIPPHQRAFYELRELEDKKLWQQGKVKEYYSEVTGIIRRFFEGRWNIVALELTSDEILRKMKLIPDSQKVWQEMQSFFTTADLVKFAKYQPDPEEHQKELQWAYNIVRAMEPREQVAKEEIEYAG